MSPFIISAIVTILLLPLTTVICNWFAKDVILDHYYREFKIYGVTIYLFDLLKHNISWGGGQ